MNKRSADAISTAVDSTDGDDLSANNISTTANPSPPPHYIKQTLVGPICTYPKCNTKVNKTKNFIISDDTLREHFKANKCINGKVNASKLERDLNIQIINMHNRIKSNPTKGEEMVALCFPNNSSRETSACCERCGYNDTSSARVKQHIKSKKNKCLLIHFKHSDIILQNEYGFRIPQAILKLIAEGKFVLPISTVVSPPMPTSPPLLQRASNSSEESTTLIQNNNSTSSHSTLDTPNSSATSFGSDSFMASPDEMNAALSSSGSTSTALSDNAEYIEALGSCFGQKEVSNALQHLSILIPITKHPRQLKDTLTTLAKHDKPDLNLGIATKLLCLAGKRWFESGSANMDVNRLGADIRNMIYIVGTCIPDSKTNQLDGDTFVATNDMKDVVPVCQSLIQFVAKADPSFIQKHNDQVMRIYDAITESEDMDEDKRESTAADRIAVTNIIPGLLSSLLIQGRTSINGTNLVGQYIAASTVKISNRNGLSLRNPNEISRSANALLRVLRHGLCSFIHNKSKSASNDQIFQQQIRSFITSQVQRSCSYEIITTRIRTAREIDDKSPTKVRKAYNQVTGEVFAGDTSIKKEIWSKSMDVTNHNWNASLRKLYSTTSTDLLNKVLDTNNQLIFDFDESRVIVKNGTEEEETIHIKDIRPVLPESKEDIKKCIYKCETYFVGSHCYFGSGAARGEDMKRLPESKHYQVIFNSLRYELHSRKNEKHGVKKNKNVAHWLSPIQSRLCVLQLVSLYPAVERSLTYNLTDSSQFDTLASDMFADVMGMKQSINTKWCRDLIAQITNYIAPLHLNKTSTLPIMAQQFHHSSQTHNNHYSSSTIVTDPDSNKVINNVLVACRFIWSALGDGSSSTTIRSNEVSHRNFSRDDLDNAAKKAYSSASARATDQQASAVMHLMNNFQHAFVLFGCGTGKSGIYILQQLVCCMHGVNRPKSIVISPHNALLAMHHMQATKYFLGTSLRVEKLLPSNVAADEISSDFDLLFISIHAFKDLMDKHPNQLQQWNIKNIFVDEYHNIFGELFRHTNSWTSLRNLARHSIKITLLSATANQLLMDFVGHYLALGSYKVIGVLDQYPIPDVIINVERYSDAEVLSELVQKIKQLNISKKDRTFKIHIIVITKDDAAEVREALSAESISCLMLTSDCLQSEKEDTMLAWEERDEQCMVSTIVDGIDNGAVEDVFVYRASYSLIRLIQSLGRIRPGRQNYDYATLHIFDTGYDPSRSGDLERRHNDIKVKNMVPANTDNTTVETFYRDLFNIQGYQDFINCNDRCYRKLLFLRCGIPSEDCQMCTNCRTNHAMSDAAIQARAKQDEIESNKEYVRQQLIIMKDQCVVCKRSTCDGTIATCLKTESHHYCYSCHAYSCAGNYHTNCKARQIVNDGQSCPFCFLALDKAIPESGTRDDHRRGHCIFKDRIKRVLLYEVSNIQDKGESATKLLDGCLRDNEVWYEQMGKILRLLEAQDAVLEDDEEFE